MMISAIPVIVIYVCFVFINFAMDTSDPISLKFRGRLEEGMTFICSIAIIAIFIHSMFISEKPIKKTYFSEEVKYAQKLGKGTRMTVSVSSKDSDSYMVSTYFVGKHGKLDSKKDGSWIGGLGNE